MTKKRSQEVFHDRLHDIQELASIIREDIKNLTKQIPKPQECTRKQQHQEQNKQDHYKNIVCSLQLNLATMTSKFVSTKCATDNLNDPGCLWRAADPIRPARY